MKNKLLLLVCGTATAVLLLLIFSLLMMKDAGVFPADMAAAKILTSFLSGIIVFQHHPSLAIYCLVASAVLFWGITLVRINYRRAPQDRDRPVAAIDLITVASLFAITLFVTGLFAPIGIDPHHDGIMLKPAMDIASGKILFKESFTQYGALTVFMQAAALAVFGKSLIVLRLLTSLFYGLVAVLLYLLFISFLKKWQAVLAVLLWLFMAPFYLEDGGASVLLPWSSAYSLLCQLLCILFCVGYFKKHRRYMLMLCGASAALTFLFRQPVGITILAAMLLCVGAVTASKDGAKAAIGAMLGLVSGFTVVFVCFIVYLLLAGSLADWYTQSIAFMGTWNAMETRNNPLHYLACSLVVTGFPFTKAWLWKILPLVCAALSAIVAYRLFVKKQVTGKSVTLIIILAGCISSWAQYYPVPSNDHLFWAASPMFGVAVFAAWELAAFRAKNTMRTLLFFSMIVLVFGLETAKRVDVGFNKVVGNYENNVSATTPLIKGMIIPETENTAFTRLYDTVNSYLRRYPDKTVVNLGKDALFSALAGNRPNAHCVYVNWGKSITDIYPDYYEKTAAFITTRRPLCLVPENDYCGKEILGPVLDQCGYRILMESSLGFFVMTPSAP
jgi:hypothetical protein